MPKSSARRIRKLGREPEKSLPTRRPGPQPRTTRPTTSQLLKKKLRKPTPNVAFCLTHGMSVGRMWVSVLYGAPASPSHCRTPGIPLSLSLFFQVRTTDTLIFGTQRLPRCTRAIVWSSNARGHPRKVPDRPCGESRCPVSPRERREWRRYRRV